MLKFIVLTVVRVLRVKDYEGTIKGLGLLRVFVDRQGGM